MPQTYPTEFRKKIVRLHMEEGRTLENLAKNAKRKPSQIQMFQTKWSL